jgi:hypothetical protein
LFMSFVIDSDSSFIPFLVPNSSAVV